MPGAVREKILGHKSALCTLNRELFKGIEILCQQTVPKSLVGEGAIFP